MPGVHHAACAACLAVSHGWGWGIYIDDRAPSTFALARLCSGAVAALTRLGFFSSSTPLAVTRPSRTPALARGRGCRCSSSVTSEALIGHSAQFAPCGAVAGPGRAPGLAKHRLLRAMETHKGEARSLDERTLLPVHVHAEHHCASAHACEAMIEVTSFLLPRIARCTPVGSFCSQLPHPVPLMLEFILFLEFLPVILGGETGVLPALRTSSGRRRKASPEHGRLRKQKRQRR